MDITPLTAYFARYWPLDDEAAKAMAGKITHRHIKRRECILKAGEECYHFTFVVKGCLKMYKVDDKGNAHNLQFAIESSWITDYGSCYAEEPSELYIEALEPTEVLQIEKYDMFDLFSDYPIFDRNFRIIIENTFIEQQKRILQIISSTAEERYQYFLKKYPHLFNRISNVQIASYLGVTPEFLSVVRKKMAGR